MEKTVAKNFLNEPLLDFSIAEIRQQFKDALDTLDARIVTMSLLAFPVIDGRERRTAQKYERYDPSDSHELVGTVGFADHDIAEEALRVARDFFPIWSATPVAERVAILRRAAERMRRDRMYLAALMVREAGKPWKEADADVAEAIDFCVYYALQMERLGAGIVTEQLDGEENVLTYRGRGPAVIIAPWNFPLAILTGMTVAALVAGNPVIIKPAEQTGLIAAELFRILVDSGAPPQAVAFLPGLGEEVGKLLVESPDTHIIAFTGSRPVGLEIIRGAATVHSNQYHIKKVIAELGGKNAIIVDADADLDEAVKGILYSAFGFAGQKCSACSRLIVVGDAYGPLLERLCDAAGCVACGQAQSSETLIGPLIDSESQDRVLALIEKYSSVHPIAFRGTVPSSGFFVPPVIFRDVPVESELWREEIFAPVLAARQAADFSEALRLANDSAYALTGGLFSRSPRNIARAKQEFEVGNLYINRGCTGALVCRQPFGGFKLSGIGSKAGGPDYLLQFVEPRAISENTMRRGFAPTK